MYHLRPFRNSDPPALVELWRRQGRGRRLFRPMTVMIFEHFVLSKPYFDRNGLIVAERDGQVCGYVHAGFGPNESGTDVSCETGVISMLQWDESDPEGLCAALLRAAETYLAERGVAEFVAGPYPPLNPFYHGLCEVSELAGVLESDGEFRRCLEQAGYEPREAFELLDCDLSSLPPVVDRKQRMLARTHEVRALLDHEFDNWWDTCTHGPIQRSAFEVIAKIGLARCGSLVWWNVDLEGTGLAPPAVSLARLEVPPDQRRAGMATFLVTSALKQLKNNGTARAQIQIPQNNDSARSFFQKLGFKSVDAGTSFRKSPAR